ncbi:striatin-3-like isoform X7 [Crassostrea angulata]|uniref:Striatin N-terminal domain-containing protein n=1 Tax=Magallana gigas TaxID=29159 RepID=A0A8W8IFW1_MAGGI|nr:striatin-3 isoform X12 [Crassostrea gigas]XP_052697374.1 striatin-3-like isoform X7 [Crassostrea angulata]
MNDGEGPGSQHAGQLGPVSGAMGMMTKQQADDVGQRPQYSMPGILHFLQTEWARFEMERSQWEVERAELQARIAFLQGERKGQENLKQDLVRRIKMLEFALKQERAKYHKLKYGTELNQEDLKPPSLEKKEEDAVDGEVMPSAGNVSWRQGRHLLRQYLQEIGYTDTIIDVRSARVRSLLGLQAHAAESEAEGAQPAIVQMNGEVPSKRAGDQGKARGKKMPASLVDSALLDSEASVLATLDFLGQDGMEDEDNLSDEDDGLAGEEESEVKHVKKRPKMQNVDNIAMMEDDTETEEALAEFDFLVEEAENGAGEAQSHGDGPEWGLQGGSSIAFPSDSRKQIIGTDPDDESFGEELGELADLTVNNEADQNNYDISSPKEAYRKTWNAKYTLRSHFDGVRSLAFHPVDPVLITASEDHTLKLWNLQKTVPAKKATSLDVEPVYTFRAHIGPVLCLAVNSTGEQCFSGGQDSTIRCWNIPSSNIDPYDSFDQNVLNCTLEGHTNAVWGLSVHSSKMQLLSCSADGTVRLWSPGQKPPLLQSYTAEEDDGAPTSVDFVRCDPSQMVASYSSSNTYIYDIETGKQVLCINTKSASEDGGNNQINCVVNHPTLPVTITAHEDRNIRFFDNTTGKLIHSMVAHLNAVSSLAVDPNGLYLLSGSHDCSIRLWNLDSKTCVQEITAHRKKFEESIHDVAFHPSKPYIASAGADALAKVFV